MLGDIDPWDQGQVAWKHKAVVAMSGIEVMMAMSPSYM
jgi:hypothetical protein